MQHSGLHSPVETLTERLAKMWSMQHCRQNMWPQGSLRMLRDPSKGDRHTGHSLSNTTADSIFSETS